MNLQYIYDNSTTPPTQSQLQYKVDPDTVFVSTVTQQMYANLTITIFNPSQTDTVTCQMFQFGFNVGALYGDLTTSAAGIETVSDQCNWTISEEATVNPDDPTLYQFSAPASGMANQQLAPNQSLGFHLNGILINEAVGEGGVPIAITEVTGTSGNPSIVAGEISISKEQPMLSAQLSVVPSTPINPGQSVTLNWEVTGSDHWQLYDYDNETLLYDSEKNVPPNAHSYGPIFPPVNTNYELLAFKGGLFTPAYAEAMVRAVVINASGPENPVNVPSHVQISWTTRYAQTVTIQPIGQTADATTGQGTFTVQMTEDTLYTLTATGMDNTSAHTSVQVYVNPPSVVSFAAAPQIYQPGATVTLSWQTQSTIKASLSYITLGSNEVISMGRVAVNNNDYPVQPTGITTYILTLEGQGQTTGQIAIAPTPQDLTQNSGDEPFGGIIYDNVSQVMWVVNEHSIVPLKASDGTMLGQPVSFDNPALAIAFDGTYIWVGLLESGLAQVQASDGVVVASGIQQGSIIITDGIFYDSVNEILWVTHDGVLSRIKASDKTLAGPDLQLPGQWRNIAFDGVNAWVAVYSTQELYLIRASDGTIIKNVPSSAWCLTFDGNNVWAGCGDGHVRKFDGEGNVLASYPSGDYLNDIIFDGTNIWTADSADSTLSMINATDGTLLASFPIEVNPNLLAFDGASIWVIGMENDGISHLFKF